MTDIKSWMELGETGRETSFRIGKAAADFKASAHHKGISDRIGELLVLQDVAIDLQDSRGQGINDAASIFTLKGGEDFHPRSLSVTS